MENIGKYLPMGKLHKFKVAIDAGRRTFSVRLNPNPNPNPNPNHAAICMEGCQIPWDARFPRTPAPVRRGVRLR